MLLHEFLQVLLMLGLYVVRRLNLNGNAGISDYGINFIVGVGVTISKVFFAACISEVSMDFLHHEAFKGVPVFRCTRHQVETVQNIVWNAHIKEVELRRLVQFAFDHLPVRLDFESQEGIVENLEIGLGRID